MHFAIAVLVFVVVTLAAFAGLSLLDERNAQARLLRDRLSESQKPAEQPLQDVALVRDEMLSRIPAFDAVLRRSERVSLLQKMLTQGNVNVRAGNFLMFCVVGAAAFGLLFFIAGGNLILGWAGAILGFFVPYAYASHMRQKRFQRFEEKFPVARNLKRSFALRRRFFEQQAMIGAARLDGDFRGGSKTKSKEYTNEAFQS